MIRWCTPLLSLAVALAACDAPPRPETATSATAAAVTAPAGQSLAECHIGNPGDDGYCTPECPCEIGEADCNASTGCAPGLKCLFNVGADYGYNPSVDVCACPLAGDAGSASFCSERCPCDDGGGDCDGDLECAPGLKCYNDAGAAYGYDATDDVCAGCLVAGAMGSVDFCNPACACAEGEGDCDVDADCDAGLRCFLNVGGDFGLPPDVDVCAACSPPSRLGAFDFCDPACPCSEGEGDCDTDADCEPGLTCFANTGADYGYTASTGVCATCPPPSLAGTFDFCSTQCPCGADKGDCDSDAECLPGLVCVNNVGPAYGWDPEVDVCQPAP